MKLSPLVAFLLLGASSAFATVTLQFSSTSVYATNFADAAGAGGSTLVWGIIIDTAGDGFDFTNQFLAYQGGVTIPVPGGQSLTSSDNQPSDDYLFVSSNLMNLVTTANDGSVIGQNRISNATNVPWGQNGIGQGDPFAIVWFNRTTSGGALGFGDRLGAIIDPAFTIPADGSTVNFTTTTTIFTGADPLKPMSYFWTPTPEPSSALLGLLGAVSLLRRRR